MMQPFGGKMGGRHYSHMHTHNLSFILYYKSEFFSRENFLYILAKFGGLASGLLLIQRLPLDI